MEGSPTPFLPIFIQMPGDWRWWADSQARHSAGLAKPIIDSSTLTGLAALAVLVVFFVVFLALLEDLAVGMSGNQIPFDARVRDQPHHGDGSIKQASQQRAEKAQR